MKSVVINLKSRADRRELFSTNNKQFLDDIRISEAVNGAELTHSKLIEMGFDTDKSWRDPILGRVLTRGEIGCFLSHYHIWEMVAAGNEPVAIFEDDVVLHKPLSEVEHLLGNHEMMYLVYSEVTKKGRKSVGEHLWRPCYPYWLAAYVLTPSGAQKLIDTNISHNIIPCDEYVPRMTDRLDVVALKDPICRQAKREELGTNIEPRSEGDYFRDFTTHVLTCGNSEEKMKVYIESARRLGIPWRNILTREWQGSNMLGPGGGQKINEIRDAIANLPDHDVVLFTDAFDVFFVRGLDEIIGRFLGYKSEIVFSAESSLWPDPSLQFPPCHTTHRYLNSGTFIGRVGELKRLFADPIQDHDDDQLYIQQRFLTGRYDIKLDVESYLFQTHELAAHVKNGSLFNPLTACFPAIYHGNGGNAAKAHFEELYRRLYPPLKYAFVAPDEYEVIGDEMLLIDFLTPSQCQELIDVGEKHGGWHPDPHDKFPSHDIHLKLIPGLWEEMEHHWHQVVARVTGKYWPPSVHHHMRKAFLMKYSEDTQKTLGFHNDASLVTGSVKLNDNYTGGTLHFKRQGINNLDIPIGKMILFPGQLTHGHYVDELTSGTKYSLTFWTARWNGDYLDP